mgnify:FL=1
MEELVRKAKRGDSSAFAELVRLCTRSMYRVAWTYLGNDEDAADAISETVLVCYEKIETLKKDAYFKTWMIRILINQCKDILKHRSRIQSKAEMQESAFEDSGYIDCEWKEVLSCLDEKYRIILLLYYTREMDTREIAELLDISRNTVITRLARGRKLLKRELEGGKIYG